MRPSDVPIPSATTPLTTPDREARAQAVDHGRQHVAALPVRAEPVDPARHALRARGELGIHDADLHQVVGVLRRKPGTDKRGEKQAGAADRRRSSPWGSCRMPLRARPRRRLGARSRKRNRGHAALPEADARIEQRIEDVDHEVDHDEQGHDHEQVGHDHRTVEAHDGIDQKLAHARARRRSSRSRSRTR